MLGRGVIILAIVVYLLVLGCVMVPSDAPARKLSSDPAKEAGSEETGDPAPARRASAGKLSCDGA